MTYGTLVDDYETKNAIFEASDTPFIIIIVGVGKTNYEKIADLERKDEKKHCLFRPIHCNLLNVRWWLRFLLKLISFTQTTDSNLKSQKNELI